MSISKFEFSCRKKVLPALVIPAVKQLIQVVGGQAGHPSSCARRQQQPRQQRNAAGLDEGGLHMQKRNMLSTADNRA